MIHKLNNNIKTHIIYKKKMLLTKLNKSELLLAKLLLKLNIIIYIKKINKNNSYLLKINCNNLTFKHLKNLYQPSQKLSISLLELKKISFTTKNILILSTNKGFITNYQAIKYKISGILVLKLFN